MIRIFAGWTIWVWGTRIWNIFGDDNSTGFIVVHVGLALVSVILAVAALVVVSRVRRPRPDGQVEPLESASSSPKN